MNYRELLKEMGDILRVTPLMRILHFSSWKATYLKKHRNNKKIGVATLLEEYKTRNSACGKHSEKLNLSWVDMASTIDTRMLSIPEAKEALIEAEDFPCGTNPVEGISMLQFFLVN